MRSLLANRRLDLTLPPLATVAVDAKISGRALLGAVSYAKSLRGEQSFLAAVSDFEATAREVLGQRIVPSKWYPYGAYAALLRTLDGWGLDSPEDAMETFGRWALVRDAGTVLRILSIFTTVDGLIHRGFGSWGDHLWRRHCDQGSVFLADSGEGTATMGLRGVPWTDRIHCRMIVGYLGEMGRQVGGGSLSLSETRCVHRGDPHCEFHGEWGRG